MKKKPVRSLMLSLADLLFFSLGTVFCLHYFSPLGDFSPWNYCLFFCGLELLFMFLPRKSGELPEVRELKASTTAAAVIHILFCFEHAGSGFIAASLIFSLFPLQFLRICLCGFFPRKDCLPPVAATDQVKPSPLKRPAELIITYTAIVLLLPLFLLIALILKLQEKSPVFYLSPRLGQDGKPIKVCKFRTMRGDADESLELMKKNDSTLSSQWENQFKLDNDPRITAIGKFLRKTSLDELPQLWNVLKGNMALVGPRPIVKEEIRKYGHAYELLKQVKPGMTGLWQVSGRSSLTYRRRVELDCFYAAHRSLWLDYFILLKTPLEVLLCRGAC